MSEPRAFNDPTADCCLRDVADCDCLTRKIPVTELTRGHFLMTVSGPKEVSYVDWARKRAYVVFMDGMTSPLDPDVTGATVTIIDREVI